MMRVESFLGQQMAARKFGEPAASQLRKALKTRHANLLGNLRAIATIRLGPPPVGAAGFAILRDFAWDNAFGLPVAPTNFLAVARIASTRDHP